MPTRKPSKKQTAEIARPLASILSLNTEDGGEPMLRYRPQFRNIAGSTNGAILLNQIWYYFKNQDFRPFYKFIQPCEHELYRAGDSWTELLNWSYDEFNTALRKIGTKVTSGTSKTEAYKNSIVVYWTDSSQVTRYDMSLLNFAREVHKVYSENPLDNSTLSNYLELLEVQIIQKSVEPELPSLRESSKINNKSFAHAVPPSAKGEKKALSEALLSTPTQLETFILSNCEKEYLTEAMKKRLNKPSAYYDEQAKAIKTGLSANALFDANPAYREWLEQEALPYAFISSTAVGKPSASHIIYVVENQKRFRKWCEEEGYQAMPSISEPASRERARDYPTIQHHVKPPTYDQIDIATNTDNSSICDILVTYTDGSSEQSVSLSSDHEDDWDWAWKNEIRAKYGTFYANQCTAISVRFPDGSYYELEES